MTLPKKFNNQLRRRRDGDGKGDGNGVAGRGRAAGDANDDVISGEGGATDKDEEGKAAPLSDDVA